MLSWVKTRCFGSTFVARRHPVGSVAGAPCATAGGRATPTADCGLCCRLDNGSPRIPPYGRLLSPILRLSAVTQPVGTRPDIVDMSVGRTQWPLILIL